MYNPNAFSSFQEKRYKNWDGPVCTHTWDFIKTIEDIVDMNGVTKIFDIGSRDGCQALELADWFPGSEVVAFEPVPSNAEWCRENFKDRKEIMLMEVALSNKHDKADFYKVVNGNVGASSLYEVNPEHHIARGWVQEKIQVQVYPAATIIGIDYEQAPELVWMDVQGAELEVVEGFGRFLEDVHAIHSEVGLSKIYKESTLKQELVDYLNKRGFRVVNELKNDLNIEEDLVFVNERFYPE